MSAITFAGRERRTRGRAWRRLQAVVHQDKAQVKK